LTIPAHGGSNHHGTFPNHIGTKAHIRSGSVGRMLDAFDAMLYALVLAHVMRDLGMTKATAGLLNSLTLVASGIGGVGFGFIADRIGRKRALMLSIVTYSVCSFASGLSTSVAMLAGFRFTLGLGMGGEWNTGAALVAETWPITRQGDCHGAELVGHWLRLCSLGSGYRAALRRLENGIFRWHPARDGDIVDPERCAGVGPVETTAFDQQQNRRTLRLRFNPLCEYLSAAIPEKYICSAAD
jgi:hypothetical protein